MSFGDSLKLATVFLIFLFLIALALSASLGYIDKRRRNIKQNYWLVLNALNEFGGEIMLMDLAKHTQLSMRQLTQVGEELVRDKRVRLRAASLGGMPRYDFYVITNPGKQALEDFRKALLGEVDSANEPFEPADT